MTDSEKQCCDNCKFFCLSANIIGCGACSNDDGDFRYDMVDESFCCDNWTQKGEGDRAT